MGRNNSAAGLMVSVEFGPRVARWQDVRSQSAAPIAGERLEFTSVLHWCRRWAVRRQRLLVDKGDAPTASLELLFEIHHVMREIQVLRYGFGRRRRSRVSKPVARGGRRLK